MIAGRTDSWFTVDELSKILGRSVKTLENWRSEGRIQFVSLCGVPLVALSHIENLITGVVLRGTDEGSAALRMMNRTDRNGRRAAPERHRAGHLDPIGESRLSVHEEPERNG